MEKALYLEIESDENYIHLDESVLAYVHILEVLADEFKDNFKKKITEDRKQIITEILECANTLGYHDFDRTHYQMGFQPDTCKGEIAKVRLS